MMYCIIDISNLVHRAKHAVGRQVGKTYKGANPFDDDPFDTQPEETLDSIRVGLILTVVFTGILNAFNKFGSDHCVAAFDKNSWRRDIYPEYKGHRRNKLKTPADEKDAVLIAKTIDEVKDFLQKYTNVTVLSARGAEADDFIARWVQIHNEPDQQHVIVSADGDFKQLVSNTVNLYNPMTHVLYAGSQIVHQDHKKRDKTSPRIEMYGQDWTVVTDKNGEPETFDPAWELFEKCIRGDSSDNISSAWPRVRTTKMKAAFFGSVTEYNNFINSTWGAEGDTKSVRQLFTRNKKLIDLTAQPDEIIQIMDDAIFDAVSMERAKMVGAYFAKFCGKYQLSKLQQQADRFTTMLVKGY